MVNPKLAVGDALSKQMMTYWRHFNILVNQKPFQVQPRLPVWRNLLSNSTVARNSLRLKILEVPDGIFFSKYQLESEKLPPTSSALKFKIHRSHYVSLIWRSSDISRPCLPNPEIYGWEATDCGLSAVMTDALPAPKVIEMTICRCKSNCQTKRCMCNKNDLKCSEMCLCVDCQNDDQYESPTDSDDSDEEN